MNKDQNNENSSKVSRLSSLSCCMLATSVFAADETSVLSFTQYANIQDTVCGAELRTGTYVVKNISTVNAHIDSLVLQQSTDITNPNFVTINTADSTCYNKTLLPNRTCTVQIDINPEVLNCPTHAPIEGDYSYNDLYVNYTANSVTGYIEAFFELAVTTLGSTVNYALLADKIYADPRKTATSAEDGMLQVSQDVSAARPRGIHDKDDILFHDGQIRPFSYSYGAFYDATAIFDTFKAAVFDDDHKKDSKDCFKLSGNIAQAPINGGFYCLDKDAYISGELEFFGSSDTLFVMYIGGDDKACEGHPDCGFTVKSDASYNLITSGSIYDKPNPNNILWIADKDSAIRLKDGAQFVGNIFTKGIVETVDSDGYSAASILGSISGLTQRQYNNAKNEDRFTSVVSLNNVSILDPNRACYYCGVGAVSGK